MQRSTRKRRNRSNLDYYTKRNIKTKYDKEIVVTHQQPLLEFLLENVKGKSRNNIKHLLSAKKVLVDGVCVSQFDYLLHAKQIVRLSANPIKQTPMTKDLDVIYEDDDLIAINKPAGLLSIATDKEDRYTAYRMVSDYVKLRNKKDRVFVVHRIDKETSGVLMFTKSLALKDLLQEDWNNNTQLREYVAIVDGKMKKKEDTIKNYLLETSTHLMYVTTNRKAGAEAITHYRVVKENDKYSMLEVKIDTGRKNQIRVSLNELGNTVIGDDKYGKPSDPLKRLGLHAHKLVFMHPITKEKIKLVAPIPRSFNTLFK